MTVEAFADHLGVSTATVAKWERRGAGITPLPDTQAILDTALSRATDEQRARFESADLGHRSTPSTASSDRPLDLVTVAGLRETVRSLVAGYDVTPSVSLLAPAAQCQAAIVDLRSHAPAGAVRRELYAVEAEAAILMGQLVWDASQRRDHAVARQHFDHAITLAEQIHDPVMQAHAVLRSSYIALYGTPDPTSGLTLASEAAQLSQDSSSALTGLALLHVAEAQAMLGERHSCERALADAERHFADRTDSDAAIDCYSPTQIGRLAGSCYLSLGLPERAEEFLADTAQAMVASEKVGALVLGNLALAQLRQQHVDEAVAVLHSAIDVLNKTRGGAGLNVVFGAGRELSPWRTDPSVHEVHDRMLGLLATA
jgi:transcriptional regulator with XRE-family HTH domain